MYELGFLFKKSVDSIHEKLSGIERFIAREYSFDYLNGNFDNVTLLSKTTTLLFPWQNQHT